MLEHKTNQIIFFYDPDTYKFLKSNVRDAYPEIPVNATLVPFPEDWHYEPSPQVEAKFDPKNRVWTGGMSQADWEKSHPKAIKEPTTEQKMINILGQQVATLMAQQNGGAD